MKYFHPLGAARCAHLLRYLAAVILLRQAGQGLVVENYGSTPKCLANERIMRVKNPG